MRQAIQGNYDIIIAFIITAVMGSNALSFSPFFNHRRDSHGIALILSPPTDILSGLFLAESKLGVEREASL